MTQPLRRLSLRDAGIGAVIWATGYGFDFSWIDIAVLNPAVPPLLPAFPLLKLNVALACVLGALLGIGTALLTEIAGRRLRMRTDLTDLAGVPLLAVLRAA